MTRLLLAGAAALGMMAGTAMAQTSSSSSMTTTTTTAPSAPVITSTSQTVGSKVTAEDVKSRSAGMTATDSTGATTQTTVTNTTYPLTDLVTSQKKTTKMVNGVAVETIETTQSHPPAVGRPTIPPETTVKTTVLAPK
jgi:hypothetical protein